MSGNLGDFVGDSANTAPTLIDQRVPDAPCAWTLRQLHQTANAFARGLIARGYARGDRIAIASENRAEFLCAYLGILRAGMVAVPVNIRLSPAGIEHIIEDAEVRLAVTDAARRALLAPRIDVVDFDAEDHSGWPSFLDPGEITSVAPGPSDIAKILYTSGSTGLPKGVPIGHAGASWAMSRGVAEIPGVTADRTIIVAPMYHKNGLVFAQLALATRMPFVLQSGFDVRRYLQAVIEHRVTVLSGIPTMFALLARETERAAQADLSAIRLITVGSAPLTDALLAKLRGLFPKAQINNGYGVTEAGPAIFGPHPQGLARPPLSIGYPYPEVEWKLIDGPSACEGTLMVRTPATLREYLNLPQATAERVRDGWFITGDVLRHDDAGFFYFVGRADDMFVCGGENVYPGEVETLLETHPAVVQACVVPVADEIKGHIPVAFVVLRAGASASAEDIRQFTLNAGPAFSHPRCVIIKDELPLSGSHKVDRRRLNEDATRAMRATGRR